MFKRSWVRILAHILDGYDIFHINFLLKLYCLFEKTKINVKEARVFLLLPVNLFQGHTFDREFMNISRLNDPSERFSLQILSREYYSWAEMFIFVAIPIGHAGDLPTYLPGDLSSHGAL